MKTYIILLVWLLSYIQTQIIIQNCPSTSNHIFSSTIKLTLNIPSNKPSKETNIYSYPLIKPFEIVPSIAIGITNLESQGSPYLMLNIKPLIGLSTNSLSFLVRFYYRYTNWNMITFNFIAENREDIQSNYYELDTQQLATNTSGKAIQLIIPYLQNYTAPTLIYFLQGFEMITTPIQSNSSYNSPFQIQIIAKNQTKTNVRLIISTISSTQIISIILGYVVYQTNQPLFQSGFYQYKDFNSINYLNISLILKNKSLYFFGGITGFVIPNNQGNLQLNILYVEEKNLIFTFNPPAYYVLYQYFAFRQPVNHCFYCNHYPYAYNGQCVNKCPQNTTLYQNNCHNQCQLDEVWNVNGCQKLCSGGSIWSLSSKKCQCPGSLIWDGQNCIICPFGQIWLQFQLKCSCSQSQFWNNYFCEDIHNCPQNQTFSTQALSCICKDGYYLTDTICLKCPNGSINGSCICESFSIWNGSKCSHCLQNMLWDAELQICYCKNGLFNGINCIQCTGGRIFIETNSLCVCSSNYLWNGQICVQLCNEPFVYINGACNCPHNTYLSQNSCINSPQCPDNMFWFNNGCVSIQCNVGFYWNGFLCINSEAKCAPNTYWDGQRCIFYNLVCPNGTNWNGSYCRIKQGVDCPSGTYVKNNNCIYFPQLCLPVYNWNGSSCLLVQLSSISCLKNQYYNGVSCVQPSCLNGKIWNTAIMQCVCQETKFWNGLDCIECPQNHIFNQNGCICKQGLFAVDNKCVDINIQFCLSIDNAQWINNHCVCKPGFTVIGFTCICNGLITEDICDYCYNIPNTIMYNGKCQCKNGYYLLNSQCIPFQPNNITNPKCQIGTVLNSDFNICVPCSDGCLSCKTSLMCLQCRPQYTYNWNSYSCIEICGDGKRFTLGCDDGNNVNGDGCSSDCHVQLQYTCFGGSPISTDFCTLYVPPSIVINIRGVTHLYGQIIVNVMTNYLPLNLTDISKPCDSKCNKILTLEAKGMYSPLSYTNLISQYRKGSLNSFAILINFGKEPIDKFILKVGINPEIARQYFPSIDISKIFDFQINPAYLSMLSKPQDLN